MYKNINYSLLYQYIKLLQFKFIFLILYMMKNVLIGSENLLLVAHLAFYTKICYTYMHFR